MMSDVVDDVGITSTGFLTYENTKFNVDATLAVIT